MFRSRISLLSVALICFVHEGHAQQGGGTISGAITDQTGAAVKGFRVTLLNTNRQYGNATISRQQSLLAYPYYTSVTVRNPHLGNSIYHAGLLTVQKRLRKGLTFPASYTKAKLIDDSVASPINSGAIEQVNNNTYQNGAYNRGLARSLDPTDIPQRVALSVVYKLPFGTGQQFDTHNRFGNLIVSGRQTQTIVTLQRRHPILISGANNNLATRPNSTGVSPKLPYPTQYEWFNTAAFVNPPIYTGCAT